MTALACAASGGALGHEDADELILTSPSLDSGAGALPQQQQQHLLPSSSYSASSSDVVAAHSAPPLLVQHQLPPAADLPKENVRVAVRVRPMVTKERIEQQKSCLRVHAAERQIVIGKDRAFTYDFVFEEGATQQRVYDEACAPLLEGCMRGYNATVFAYGQTGSGKTYTMGSGHADASAEGAAARGVIPRIVDGLFDALAAQAETTDFAVRVSYLEIYNEEVKDLLHPRTPSKAISIREGADGGIFVLGVQERAVATREQLLEALNAGTTNRQTGSTLMNASSSRSHSLFTVMVEQTPKAPAPTAPSPSCTSSTSRARSAPRRRARSARASRRASRSTRASSPSATSSPPSATRAARGGRARRATSPTASRS